MKNSYILGIDQSTQGTKALLFDGEGRIVGRSDLPHEQIINELGWVEHDPIRIYRNMIAVVKDVVSKTGVDRSRIVGVGLTNQRETAAIWDRETGLPVYNAIVWQCARGASICKRIEASGEMIREHTGLNLSPYFTAAKIAWVLENVEGAKVKSEEGKLAYGTMDSWLVYQLTKGRHFKTDYSNASRTQLFNINSLSWDREVCDLFGINMSCLAEVCDSDACYGYTDFDGFLDHEIPIHSVLGDSHGALFGQQCHQKGMIKTTYGTGSSIMMNIGEKPIFSSKGIVTSLAWGINGKLEYVLEGNINYSGAVISWLKNDMKLINHAAESENLAYAANPADRTYLIPAFTGLGAPYWNSEASAMLCGMTRLTGKAEIVKAALESIAYQITDIINVMREESGITIKELRVDGGPTRNTYLMQFQSDLLDIPIQIPDTEELSVIGAAYASGIAMGIYDRERVFANMDRHKFMPKMEAVQRKDRMDGWRRALGYQVPQFQVK